MNCKFIEKNDIHERYILNRLSDSEKAEYLFHIKECDSCARNLENEKILLSSIQHIGKRKIKSEIAQQVAELKAKETTISWDMILKVAAIFFFLVITPALVFYYQSIETPKISETTDFDKLLSRKKENEFVKEEKSEYKTTEIADSKGKKDENISDIIKSEGYAKSAGGSAAERSLRSVNISKPSAESNQLAEEIIIEDKSTDKAPEEVVPPLSAVPQSRIPSLGNFQKPVNVRVTDEELNMSGDLRSKKMTVNSHSKMSNKTQDEAFNEEDISIAGKEKSGQISKKKLSEDKIYILDFILNNKKIVINLVPLNLESESYLQESFPDSFQVIKKKNENVDLAMDWFIDSRIRNLNPEDISVYLKEKEFLYINILDEKFYQIDLKTDSTKAITIQ